MYRATSLDALLDEGLKARGQVILVDCLRVVLNHLYPITFFELFMSRPAVFG